MNEDGSTVKKIDEYPKHILNGEDINIGIYNKPKQSIKEANHNLILRMIKLLPSIKKSTKILNLNLGYSETSKFLVDKYFCKVDSINPDENINKHHLKKLDTEELQKLLTLTTSKFEKLPFESENYNIVWAQDVFLKNVDNLKVFQEIARVLTPGGRFIFTSLLLHENANPNALKKLATVTSTKDLGLTKEYIKLADKVDLERVFIKELPEQLTLHYSKLLETLKHKKSSKAVIKDKIKELELWLEASEKGHLSWGIFQFQKRND